MQLNRPVLPSSTGGIHLTWLTWAQKFTEGEGLTLNEDERIAVNLLKDKSTKPPPLDDLSERFLFLEREWVYALIFQSALDQVQTEMLFRFERKEAADRALLNRGSSYRILGGKTNPKYSGLVKLQFLMQFAAPSYSPVVRFVVNQMLPSYYRRLTNAGNPLYPKPEDVAVAALITNEDRELFVDVLENALPDGPSKQRAGAFPAKWAKYLRAIQSAFPKGRVQDGPTFFEAAARWCKPYCLMSFVAESFWDNFHTDLEELQHEPSNV